MRNCQVSESGLMTIGIHEAFECIFVTMRRYVLKEADLQSYMMGSGVVGSETTINPFALFYNNPILIMKLTSGYMGHLHVLSVT